MFKRLTLIAIGVLLISACASAGSSGPRRQSDLITAEEIQAANVSNLYQVVERLRPRWLDSRARQSFNSPQEIVVYQGQTFLGGVEMLREFGPDSAFAIRYLDGPTASATLPGIGMRQVEAAIVINPQ